MSIFNNFLEDIDVQFIIECIIVLVIVNIIYFKLLTHCQT